MEENNNDGQIKVTIKKIAQQKLIAVFLSSPVLLIIGVSIIFLMIMIIILLFASGFSMPGNVSYGYYNLPENLVVANEGSENITYPLEEYVSRVVAQENGYFKNEDKYPNATMKAQAVVARTYAIVTTDNGNKTIENSTNAQTLLDDKNPNTSLRQELINYGFSEKGADSLLKAVDETKGEVLTYNNKAIFAQYDSSCIKDNCEGLTECTLIYNKQPSGEEHTFTIPATYIENNKYKIGNCEGNHGQGMSQVYARYLQTEKGYPYEDILAFFYDKDVKITKTELGFTEDTITITREEQKFDNRVSCFVSGQTQNRWAVDNTSLSNELKSFVGSAAGTRIGPVKAAYYLANILTQRYNVNLPYFFGGGHGARASNFPPQEPILGVHPKWGTCTSLSYGKYTNPQLYGLDCSGFVLWSIVNGGYNLGDRIADGYKTVGDLLRGSGRFLRYDVLKDNEIAIIQAGDLVLNYDPIDKVYGHIGIIISINKEAKTFYIAEAEATSVGLTVTKSLNLTDWDNVILMDKYYNNPQNVRSK